MRVFLTLCLCLFAMSAFAQDQPAAEKPWFDMENCGFCKQLATQPGLVEHMRHEYHNISYGVLSLTYIDADYKDEFAAAQKGMQAVAEGMGKGEIPTMCRHCTKYGELYMKGVKIDQVMTEEAVIVTYTHTDPAVIAEIQEFGKNSAEATAKMSAKPAEK